MEPACEIVPAIESVERNNFMLPTDWVVINEVHSRREPYGHCVGCRCFEHTAGQYTSREAYAIAFNESFAPPPFRRGQSGRRTKYRCSRCGRYGHNKRTCHGPLP
ncbi:hypothetical protein Q3G72_014483 [Acer saccharum]|nr:hypothetical protein Q3G72_014483 [Acer saccharum]